MALAWLQRILGRTSSKPAPVRRRYRPTMDSLEDRLVPITAVTTLATITPAALVQSLIGTNTGISVSNIQYSGDVRAAGTFTGGQTSVGMSNGIILSTGLAAQAVGPHGATPSTNLGQPGDPDLNTIAGAATTDAAVLQFDFVPTGNTIGLSWIFGSGNYDANASTNVDVPGIIVNGHNVALVPGTSTPVDSATVNLTTNSQYYIDNTGGPAGGATGRNVNINGFTTVFNLTLTVNPHVINHIKFAVGDVGNSLIDSFLLLGAQGATAANGTTIAGLDTGDVNAYRPLRYIWNGATSTYDGNITVVNRHLTDQTGLNFAVFPNFPPALTIFNAVGTTPSSSPYLSLPTIGSATVLPSQKPVRTLIKISNPTNTYMSSFFLQYEVDITTALV
jgi:hypothetical protein